MNTRVIGFWAALSVTAFGTLVGCAAPDAPASREGEVGETAQGIDGFSFDSSELARMPAAEIPSDRLTTRAFDDATVQRTLIQTTQPFGVIGELGRRQELESTDWLYERDATQGQVVIYRKTPSGPSTSPDEALLQRLALVRLNGWGVPNSEIGTVIQRRALREDQDGTAPSTPQIHRYKTFVFRAINGVRVAGHRAVVTHTLDGTFNRALVKWPALASSGHQLRTRLLVPEIERLATEALRTAGETGGRVRLRWKYVPTSLTTGEVTLKLVVSALMGAEARSSGVTEEPHETTVDVSAF